MTQEECLKLSGEAWGVIEDDGTINWYKDFMGAELARHGITKTPEAQAERKAKMLEALAKGRKVKADKKAKRNQNQVVQCPGGCGYTIALCACPPIPLCEVDKQGVLA